MTLVINDPEISHVYGINTEVPGNIVFLDEQRLVYSIGTSLICYNMELKTQTFIPAAENGFEIMALACGMAKSLIAVAARNNQGPSGCRLRQGIQHTILACAPIRPLVAQRNAAIQRRAAFAIRVFTAAEASS